MTRLKATALEPIYREWVDKGGLVIGEAFRDAARNLALVYDKLTGENAEANTIVHQGVGLGCPLNLPLANQCFGGKAFGDNGGYYLTALDIIAVPVYVPIGWTEDWIVEVEFGPSVVGGGILPFQMQYFTASAYIRSSSMTISSNYPVVIEDTFIPNLVGQRSRVIKWRCLFDEGSLQYLFIQVTPLQVDAAGSSTQERRDINYTQRVSSWHMYPADVPVGQGNIVSAGDFETNQYPVQSTLTTANWKDFDDDEIVDGGPLSARVVYDLNLMANTLQELITGAPVPGNATLTCTQTVNNDRAIWTAEPLPQFPLGAFVLGGAESSFSAAFSQITSPMSAPTTGILDWARHTTAHSTSYSVFARLALQMPDFDTSPSALTCHVLFQAPNSDVLTSYTVRASTAAGASAAVALTQIAATNYYQVKLTAIPFTAGAVNEVELQIAHSANAALSHECLILGCFLGFNLP